MDNIVNNLIEKRAQYDCSDLFDINGYVYMLVSATGGNYLLVDLSKGFSYWTPMTLDDINEELEDNSIKFLGSGKTITIT